MPIAMICVLIHEGSILDETSISLSIIETNSGLLKFTSSLSSLLMKYGINYKRFVGTVIDLETDGQPFLNKLGAGRYKQQCATSCAILDKNNIEVIAKTCDTPEGTFAKEVDKRLGDTNHPYYAFNSGFDMAILSKLLGRAILFDRELQQYPFQSKGDYRKKLGIPNFDDPFHDDGKLAGKEWNKHLKTRKKDCVKKIMAHNLACVLKEYCILVRGGYRVIDPSSHKAFFGEKNELVCGDCQKLSE
jgi:hypothetical protein